jgi:hypothetical protein
MGQVKYIVPKSSKQVMDSPQREQWLAADRRALDISILGFDGNRLEPRTAMAEGDELCEPTVARRLKEEGGYLVAGEPFMSRISLDARRRRRARERARTVDATPTYSTSASPLCKRHVIHQAVRSLC